jgi:3-(3-hydroxy-phenyl)propionate hydroxylase
MFDIAIIGYGPAGATLANLLGQAGLSTLVVEKEAAIYPLPRAIHFDGEVMRIFQSVGLRPAVEAISRPGLKGMQFVNASGETLLVRGGTAAQGPHGCASNHYFHQPELEQVLRDGVARFGCVEVRLQHEVTEITPHEEHVSLSVTDGRSGQTTQVQARYVIGCDGARSLVRKVLGSPMQDLGLHQPWLVFDVLLKPNAPDLPDHTVQFCDPARPMTWCNVTGNRRRWEIMLMPGDDPATLVQPDTLWKLVSRWMKPEDADIERATIYTFHSVIAQGWRKGRLLLAGDSAHQTPPFLGQGMCAALRDASNLAWKLEAVLRGRAGDALLDTYESERSPHVHAFIELAVKLGDIIQATDPDKARERDARFKAGQPEIFEFPSPRLGPGVLHGDMPLVGQPFPQPVLADGRLLDEHIGKHFTVIARKTVLDGVSNETRKRWKNSDVLVLPTQEPVLLDWLDRHGVDAIMLRPDRYILGLAKTSAELDAVTTCLPVATHTTY